MNVIKGLIIKDILQLKNYKKTLIVFILIFTLTSISGFACDNVNIRIWYV